jgi:hypothetical protein
MSVEPKTDRDVPSPEILRQWALLEDNSTCWGLADLADELEELREIKGLYDLAAAQYKVNAATMREQAKEIKRLASALRALLKECDYAAKEARKNHREYFAATHQLETIERAARLVE